MRKLLLFVATFAIIARAAAKAPVIAGDIFLVPNGAYRANEKTVNAFQKLGIKVQLDEPVVEVWATSCELPGVRRPVHGSLIDSNEGVPACSSNVFEQYQRMGDEEEAAIKAGDHEKARTLSRTRSVFEAEHGILHHKSVDQMDEKVFEESRKLYKQEIEARKAGNDVLVQSLRDKRKLLEDGHGLPYAEEDHLWSRSRRVGPGGSDNWSAHGHPLLSKENARFPDSLPLSFFKKKSDGGEDELGDFKADGDIVRLELGGREICLRINQEGYRYSKAARGFDGFSNMFVRALWRAKGWDAADKVFNGLQVYLAKKPSAEKQAEPAKP